MHRCFHVTLLFLGACLPDGLARGDEAAEKLILATYKLSNESSTASAVVLRGEASDGRARLYVVTARHVLEQMTGDSCTLVSRSRQEDGTFQRREICIQVVESGLPSWKKHPHHDLAALELPESVDVEALPFDSLATDETLTEVRVGDAVRLAVFPERAEANDAGFPILRSGSIASYPLVPTKSHPMFFVDTTSWPGDSGGPVIHESVRSPSGGPLVVGFVLGMRNITDTIKESRFVERRTHYPLGISEVMHATYARELLSQFHTEK